MTTTSIPTSIQWPNVEWLPIAELKANPKNAPIGRFTPESRHVRRNS